MGGTSWNMKPMPMILLFSDARDLFSNMWNFDWNPCLIRKRANAVNDIVISVPPPVFH